MRKNNQLKKILSVGGLALLALGTLTACGNSQQQADKQSTPTTTAVSAGTNDKKLANLKYQSGKSAIVQVNHNKATIKPTWKYDHANYAKLDKNLRTSNANTGWLDKNNVANDSLRTRQVFKPTGYHQKFVVNKPIINRGHEIAYSLSKGISQSGKYDPKAKSGDQNNPKNLFTQTAFSNQELQTIYESKVRNALKQGQKVVYQVQPIFKGKNQMANGVHMQAISTNHKLDYNVYLFNVQPGIKFNYANGRSAIDKAMKVPTPVNAPHFNDDNESVAGNRRYNRNYRRYGYRRHHHFIRDYAMYRVGKHMVRKHYYNRYRRNAYRMPRYHRDFGHMRMHRSRI